MDPIKVLPPGSHTAGTHRQYYYQDPKCSANGPLDPGCICWHDEGTGPLKDGSPIVWREAPPNAERVDLAETLLDKHHRLAAEIRYLLHNGGAGPNLSRLARCDAMLCEIAGVPVVPLGAASSGADASGMSAAQINIAAECDRIKDMLLSKNKRYGNSALEPKRIFSKASFTEQICVRIDDKLSRLQTTGFSGGQEDGERTLDDLIGYLILLNVAVASVEKVSNDSPT